jgi:hypothetical protein
VNLSGLMGVDELLIVIGREQDNVLAGAVQLHREGRAHGARSDDGKHRNGVYPSRGFWATRGEAGWC